MREKYNVKNLEEYIHHFCYILFYIISKMFNVIELIIILKIKYYKMIDI